MDFTRAQLVKKVQKGKKTKRGTFLTSLNNPTPAIDSKEHSPQNMGYLIIYTLTLAILISLVVLIAIVRANNQYEKQQLQSLSKSEEKKEEVNVEQTVDTNEQTDIKTQDSGDGTTQKETIHVVEDEKAQEKQEVDAHQIQATAKNSEEESETLAKKTLLSESEAFTATKEVTHKEESTVAAQENAKNEKDEVERLGHHGNKKGEAIRTSTNELQETLETQPFTKIEPEMAAEASTDEKKSTDENMNEVNDILNKIPVKLLSYDELLDIKESANTYFKEGKYIAAMELYADAIAEIDKMNRNVKEPVGTENAESSEDIETIETPLATLHATLYSNKATCHFKLQDYAKTIAAASSALTVQPGMTKAKLRRAAAYEQMAQSSPVERKGGSIALEKAIADYTELTNSFPYAEAKVQQLKVMLKPMQAREQAEMMGKLKDMGNSLLGKFGMSLDNFNFVKDEKSGGYSMNFDQKWAVIAFASKWG